MIIGEFTQGYLMGLFSGFVFLVICFLGAKNCPPDDYNDVNPKPPRLPR